MRKIAAIFLLVCCSGFLAAQDAPILAVPTIEGKNVPEYLASTCRNIVETALIKTGSYQVLSYNDVEEILAAQAFSLSGCTDESCAIEVGQLLAAEKIVVGEITGVGDGFLLALRLIDVTTGRSVNAEVMTIESLDLLKDRVFEAAYLLAGLPYEGSAGDGTVAATGRLQITTIPGDAGVFRLFVDEEPYPSGQPIELEPGEREVVIRGNGWYWKDKVIIRQGETSRVEAELSSVGSLDLNMYAGGQAWLENENGTLIPLENGLNDNIPAGEWILVVVHGDYRRYGERIELGRGQVLMISPVMTPTEAFLLKERLAGLNAQKEVLLAKRRAFNTGLWISLVTGLVSSGVTAVYEGLLARESAELDTNYQGYLDAATTADALSFWTAVEGNLSSIEENRLIRNGALAGAGVGLTVGGILALVKPPVKESDQQIRSLEARLGELEDE